MMMSITASMECPIESVLGYGIIFLSWIPRPLCQKDCGHMDGNRHVETAQRGPCKGIPRRGRERHKQSELYMVPADLIQEIFEVIVQDNQRRVDLRN